MQQTISFHINYLMRCGSTSSSGSVVLQRASLFVLPVVVSLIREVSILLLPHCPYHCCCTQSACPTLLIASNGKLMALCTNWLDVASFSMASPSIKLIDMDNVRKRGGGVINPANVDVIAEYKLAKGMFTCVCFSHLGEFHLREAF